MEFTRKIYDYDVNRLATILVPVKLRWPRLLALVWALVSQVAYVYALFCNYKKEAAYELTITGQVCFLQKMLNDYFDYTDRRITITEEPLVVQKAMYLKNEGPDKALVSYQQGEANEDYYFITRGESVGQGGYFIVNVPTGLVYEDGWMRGLLNYYKLPTTKYIINQA